MNKYLTTYVTSLIVTAIFTLFGCEGGINQPSDLPEDQPGLDSLDVIATDVEHKFTVKTTGAITVAYVATGEGYANIFRDGINTKTSVYSETVKLPAGDSIETTLSVKTSSILVSGISIAIDNDNEARVTFTWEAFKNGKKVDDYTETITLTEEDDSYNKNFDTL